MFLREGAPGFPAEPDPRLQPSLSEKLSSQSAPQACSVARPAQQKQRKAEEAEAGGKAVHREIEEVSGEEASPCARSLPAQGRRAGRCADCSRNPPGGNARWRGTPTYGRRFQLNRLSRRTGAPHWCRPESPIGVWAHAADGSSKLAVHIHLSGGVDCRARCRAARSSRAASTRMRYRRSRRSRGNLDRSSFYRSAAEAIANRQSPTLD